MVLNNSNESLLPNTFMMSEDFKPTKSLLKHFIYVLNIANESFSLEEWFYSSIIDE
jgi:hypothetical protein